MRRLAWLVLLSSHTGCGGGKSSATLSITCTGGTQLIGAGSVDILGDLVNGRPTMNFADPANPGKMGSISVQPLDHCKVAPSGG
jgi:hypothetical protein